MKLFGTKIYHFDGQNHSNKNVFSLDWNPVISSLSSHPKELKNDKNKV